MTARRRAAQRATTQAMTTGASIREARLIAGLTRAKAAARAGIARSTWDRIEQGSPAVALENYVAACDAVGLDFVCNTYPGRPPGLRDSGQLAMAQHLATMAHARWRTTYEEPGGDHGEAIDMVLWGSTEIVAVEIERRLLNWQSQHRRWSTKRAWLQARHARPVRLVVAAADTRRNRAALAPFAAVVQTDLPAGTRACLEAVRSGKPLGADGLCWLREHP